MPKKQQIRKKLENNRRKRKSAPFDRYATPVKFDRAPKNSFCHESCQKEKRRTKEEERGDRPKADIGIVA